MVLHRFFRLNVELSEADLLEHRRAVSAAEPALPQKAGRALSHFYEILARVGVKRVRVVGAEAPQRVAQQDRTLVARPLLRPEVDVEKLARAFIGVYRQQVKSALPPVRVAQPDTGPAKRYVDGAVVEARGFTDADE